MTERFLMRGDRILGQKVIKTYYLPIEIAAKIDEYAPYKGDKSALLCRALLDFFNTHNSPVSGLPTPINITVEAKAPEQPEEVHCEIAKCKENAVTSGLYKGKEYQLCQHHAHGYTAVKGWIVK